MMWKQCLILAGLVNVIFADAIIAAPPFEIDRSKSFQVELAKNSAVGESSIREHAITWHPVKKKYYLVADVVPLNSPHHPNTYETQLHLWSSPNLGNWTWHGIVVEKGGAASSYHAHGVASPAGMAFSDGKLFVPFSARKTEKFTQRGIGLAVSGSDPEIVPWTKTVQPVSDLVGEDDDPAVLVLPEKNGLHLYHRNAGPQGYQIVHTVSPEPQKLNSWSNQTQVAPPPREVRAQELTGVYFQENHICLLIIEHLVKGGTRIAHLKAKKPDGPFRPVQSGQRYLLPERQAQSLAYSGHISPVTRNHKLVAFFWTVHQPGKRYGLLGHPVKSPQP